MEFTNMKALLLICFTILMVSIVAVFGVLKLDSNRQQRNEEASITEPVDKLEVTTQDDSEQIIEEESNEQVNIEAQDTNYISNNMKENNINPTLDEVKSIVKDEIENIDRMINRGELEAAEAKLIKMEDTYTIPDEYRFISDELWPKLDYEFEREELIDEESLSVEEAKKIALQGLDTDIFGVRHEESMDVVVDGVLYYLLDVYCTTGGTANAIFISSKDGSEHSTDEFSDLW